MSEIKSHETLVLIILENSVRARGDDAFLYLQVLLKLNPDILEMKFKDVLNSHYALNIPRYTSIIRNRQKLQQEFPDLKPAKNIRKHRKDLENEFYDYAIS